MDNNDELDLAFRAARAEQVDSTAARIERAVRAKLFATIGQRVGRYETRGVLGRGGLGIVFRGYDRALDREVAIKLIRTEDAGITPQARARLLREARALAGIVHPNVLEIFDVGEHGDDVYLVSELLEGETLAMWCSRSQAVHDILDRFVAAGRGLAAVHAAGLVHRDFKPANVVLANDARVKVIDFGLAKAISDTLASAHDDTRPRVESGQRCEVVTEHGTKVGTPRYMAPEQAQGGDVDARADVYAFCVALAEALGEDHMSRRLAPLLARGMRIDPRERWPTMNALLDALQHARVRRRSWTPVTIASLIVVGVLTVAIGSSDIAVASSAATASEVEAHVGIVTKLRGAAALATGRARFGRGDAIGAATLAEQAYWTALRLGDESMAVLAASDAMWLRANAGDGKAADIWYAHASASLARAPFARTAELRFTALAAQVFERRGELARARDLARQRFELALDIEGSDAPETHRARGQLGFVLARMGQHEGVEWCQAAVAGLEGDLGPRHPWSIAARVDLGGALQATNEHARAIAVLRDALVVADASDTRSLRLLAGAINSLALSRFQTGEDEEADALFARAITLVARALPSDRALFLLLENRARVQISLGRHADAAASIARAMDLAISRGEADTASYASALEIAGMLDLRRNEPTSALARFEAGLAIRRTLADAARLHRTEVFVARALADLGRWREAEALARPAMQALAELGAPALGDGHVLLGDIAREQGDDDAALHYRAALEAWKEEPGDADVIAQTEQSLAAVIE